MNLKLQLERILAAAFLFSSIFSSCSGGESLPNCGNEYDRISDEIEQVASTLRSCRKDEDCTMVGSSKSCLSSCSIPLSLAGIDIFNSKLADIANEHCTSEFTEHCHREAGKCAVRYPYCSDNICVYRIGGDE